MSNSPSHSVACPASRTRTATAPAARSRQDWQRTSWRPTYLATSSNLGRLLTGSTAPTQNTQLQIINPDTLLSGSANSETSSANTIYSASLVVAVFMEASTQRSR
jgi:hypothetical protein